MRKSICIRTLLLVCGLYASLAQSTPDEIEVYTDEMSAPGEFGLEQHLNFTVEGAKTPEYPGQMTSHHVTQVTPEFYYGLSNNLEAGLYLPLAFTADGYTFLNGVRLRLKYIAPHASDEHLFYGLNLEAGRNSSRVSESNNAMELRPIIGYRDEKWLASFNPILNMALDANVSHQAQFEPALKLAHSAGDEVSVGVEYYGVYGPVNQLLPGSQRAHTVYAVADVETCRFDVNFGIGHGYLNTADVWVAKGIIAMPFK